MASPTVPQPLAPQQVPASSLSKAVADIRAGWGRRELWMTLAQQDVRNRYRRSFLGPFWITVQMLAFVLGIGLLYAALFKQPPQQFVPFVATGFLIWSLMSSVIIEASTTYAASTQFIRSSQTPLSVYCYRTIAHQVIIFLHNAVVVVVMLLLLRVVPSASALVTVPLSLIITVINGFFLCLWLGPLSARYRDLAPLVAVAMQLMLFITPLFWDPSTLPGRAAVIWNPFAYFLEIFRNPLLDRPIVPGSWIVVLIITAINIVVGLLVFARSRARIAYWVA